MTRGVASELRKRALKVVTLSLDDLYLTHADQCALAAQHPTNALLQHRGCPGTHDMPLGSRIFAKLAANTEPVHIPIYDKGASGGRGDRCPTAQCIEPGSDMVLVEGWMLGFRPVPDVVEAVGALPVDAACRRHSMEVLQRMNQSLARYQEWERLYADRFVLLEPPHLDVIYAWRQEQERQVRGTRANGGMSEAEVCQFVAGYMPAYELYLAPLAARLPVTGGSLRVRLDEQRRVRSVAHM